MIIGTLLLSIGGLFLSVGLAAVVLGLLCYLFALLCKRINIWVAALITWIFNRHGYKKGYEQAMKDMGAEVVKPNKKGKGQKVKVVKVKERIVVERPVQKEVIIGAGE